MSSIIGPTNWDHSTITIKGVVKNIWAAGNYVYCLFVFLFVVVVNYYLVCAFQVGNL